MNTGDVGAKRFEIYGLPMSGATSLKVRGTPGLQIEVWRLDANHVETTMMGGATLSGAGVDWTAVSLSAALVAGEWIQVRHAVPPTFGERSRVISSRPWIVETEPAVVEQSGGTVAVHGQGFEANMDLEIVGTDGVRTVLPYTLASGTEISISVPAQPGTGSVRLALRANNALPEDGASAVDVPVVVDD